MHRERVDHGQKLDLLLSRGVVNDMRSDPEIAQSGRDLPVCGDVGRDIGIRSRRDVADQSVQNLGGFDVSLVIDRHHLDSRPVPADVVQ